MKDLTINKTLLEKAGALMSLCILAKLRVADHIRTVHFRISDVWIEISFKVLKTDYPTVTIIGTLFDVRCKRTRNCYELCDIVKCIKALDSVVKTTWRKKAKTFERG